jgi:hypothetical protein
MTYQFYFHVVSRMISYMGLDISRLITSLFPCSSWQNSSWILDISMLISSPSSLSSPDWQVPAFLSFLHRFMGNFHKRSAFKNTQQNYYYIKLAASPLEMKKSYWLIGESRPLCAGPVLPGSILPCRISPGDGVSSRSGPGPRVQASQLYIFSKKRHVSCVRVFNLFLLLQDWSHGAG